MCIRDSPWSDPQDSGYQIIQALIAIGSGGLFGMGLGLGYPRNIPLYHSDFIFAAICEEYGLIFALGLLGIYLVIVLRGASVAMNARSSFHALTALGVVALIGIQTLVIVGGNTRLIPLTGVTLPYICLLYTSHGARRRSRAIGSPKRRFPAGSGDGSPDSSR